MLNNQGNNDMQTGTPFGIFMIPDDNFYDREYLSIHSFGLHESSKNQWYRHDLRFNHINMK